jgi:hypothetical protein
MYRDGLYAMASGSSFKTGLSFSLLLLSEFQDVELTYRWLRKDAIIESYQLGAREFYLTITGLEGKYVAEARHPDTKSLLGFIRYRSKEGDLELTNFNAQLSRTTLRQGVTSKQGKGLWPVGMVRALSLVL